MLNELARAYLGAVIRWLIALVSGYLISKGIVDRELADQFGAEAALALAGALVTLLWALWNKWRGHFKLEKALAAPAGTTREQLEKYTDNKIVT